MLEIQEDFEWTSSWIEASATKHLMKACRLKLLVPVLYRTLGRLLFELR